MPKLRISMILLKAKKLIQLATHAIVMAHSSDSLADTATSTKAKSRHAPQAIWEYQKRGSSQEGGVKRASQTHTSRSPEVSTLHQASKYLRPTFLVSQNYKLEPIVTNMHATCWLHTSPPMNNPNKTTILAVRMWKRGVLSLGEVGELRLASVLVLYTTDEIIYKPMSLKGQDRYAQHFPQVQSINDKYQSCFALFFTALPLLVFAFGDALQVH